VKTAEDVAQLMSFLGSCNSTIKMRDGPKFIIDHMIAYQLFGDPEFFVKVPVFFFLRDQAQACVHQIVTNIVDRPSGQCLGCSNIRSLLMPVMLALVKQIRSLAASGDDGSVALQPLVDYISGKCNYRPRPISVYYRDDSGKISSIDL